MFRISLREQFNLICRSKKRRLWAVGLASFVVLVIGAATQSVWAVSLGVLAACYPLRQVWKWRQSKRSSARSRSKSPEGEVHLLTSDEDAKSETPVSHCEDNESLVNALIAQERYALLLRPQVVDNLDQVALRLTLQTLEDSMALVPEGEVILSTTDEMAESLSEDEGFDLLPRGRAVHVEPVYLDSLPVTNRQYQRFIDDKGYEDMALWDEEIWSAMLDFVDKTGHPGPRYWSNGAYPRGRGEHPVVGVCWYEAAAFARWCGKRLPSDAEWVKAGCWPVSISPGNWQQRRFPWGNAFETEKANLWAAGIGDTVPVHRYENGTSVGGHQQLVGNVWEWTSGAYGSPEDLSLVLPTPMKSVRGGAFDTYFESQACCQFQSGDSPLARKHNIGFRLALGTCDLAPRAAASLYDNTESVDESCLVAETN